MRPPAADTDKLDKPLPGNILDHEPDLIHMARYHDGRPLSSRAKDRPVPVARKLSISFHPFLEYGPYLFLMAGYTLCIAKGG